MAQCTGRSQRTGQRCKRSAAPDGTTCHYHGAAVEQVKETAARRRAAAEARGTKGRAAFTTKELSERTWDDFETLFAEGTGWGRCACLHQVQRASPKQARTWAEQREMNLHTKHRLLDQGRAHGILVYHSGAPIGWCRFESRDEVPLEVSGSATTRDSGAAAWLVTCFVADPSYRGRGVMGVALRAALEAIARRGGGIVEGYPVAVAPGPPPRGGKGIYSRQGDVGFYGGLGRIRFGVEVEGVGPVAAMYRRGADAYGGTVDVFRREGFQAVAVLPRPTSPRAQLLAADRIVMRRTVSPVRPGGAARPRVRGGQALPPGDLP